jgi:hypothetical protein
VVRPAKEERVDRHALRTALAATKDEAGYRSLRDAVRAMPPGELFAGVFPLAAGSQTDGPAYFAARLLWELNPPCPLSSEEAVRAMLTGWDISIEEVPFYLARQFGDEELYATVQRLEAETADHEATVRLGTIRYWAGIAAKG